MVSTSMSKKHDPCNKLSKYFSIITSCLIYYSIKRCDVNSAILYTWFVLAWLLYIHFHISNHHTFVSNCNRWVRTELELLSMVPQWYQHFLFTVAPQGQTSTLKSPAHSPVLCLTTMAIKQWILESPDLKGLNCRSYNGIFPEKPKWKRSLEDKDAMDDWSSRLQMWIVARPLERWLTFFSPNLQIDFSVLHWTVET